MTLDGFRIGKSMLVEPWVPDSKSDVLDPSVPSMAGAGRLSGMLRLSRFPRVLISEPLGRPTPPSGLVKNGHLSGFDTDVLSLRERTRSPKFSWTSPSLAAWWTRSIR